MGTRFEKCQSKYKVNEDIVVHEKYRKINNRQGSHNSVSQLLWSRKIKL